MKRRTLIIVSVLSFCFGGIAVKILHAIPWSSGERRHFLQQIRNSSTKSVSSLQNSCICPTDIFASPPISLRKAQEKGSEQEPGIEQSETQKRNNEASQKPDPILGVELEARLDKLFFKAFPAIIDPEQVTNKDGSIDEGGKSEDGNHVYRHFDPQGRLGTEKWTNQATGEYVMRKFYQSGIPKNAFWSRSENDITIADFNESGRYSHRYDNTQGTSYTTTFTDLGIAQEVYKKAQDSEGETIWPKQSSTNP